MGNQQSNNFDRIQLAPPYILCCIIPKSFNWIRKFTYFKKSKHDNPPNLRNHIKLRYNRFRRPTLIFPVRPCRFILRRCIPDAPFYSQPHHATAPAIPHRRATMFNRCNLYSIARKRSAIMRIRQHRNGAHVEARLRPPV